MQDGLTNVLQHAPGSTARVLVRVTDDGLLVRVENDRPDTATGPVLTGLGRELISLRERTRGYR